MKRRGFLKIFGKAAATVVAAPVLAKVPEKTYPWPESKGYEHVVYSQGFTIKNGVQTQGSFAKSLWPGIEKYYKQAYAKHESDYMDLFK